MPGKKKKFNARFPPARIKKIMQSNEEVGKVAAAVPVIISRALELFVDNLLKKANDVATERRAKTMTPSHLKLCIHSDARLDFLKELVTNVADLQGDLDLDQGGTSMTPASSTPQKESTSAVSASKRPEPEDGCQQQMTFPATNSVSSVTVRDGRLPRCVGEACSLSSETPGQNLVASSVPSTSIGRKRGRPRKLGNGGNVTASQRPKRKLLPKLLPDTVRNVEDRSHRHQYYKNDANYDSFPSKDDANALAHAKNVGRVCDEDEELDEDRLPANCGQQSGFRTACLNNDVKHPIESRRSNGSASASRDIDHPRNFTLTVSSDPRESFQLSFASVHKNGCNTLTPKELPSLATVANYPVKANDEDITTNCEDPQTSGDLVVDEDYDC